MTRERFEAQLAAATRAARTLAEPFLTHPLPEPARYAVLLNRSFDGNRQEDELVYPEDDGRVEPDLAADAVVTLLWRDGRCPQWIDISAAGVAPGHTLYKLLCCGRFVDEEWRLYYFEERSQPFGVKRPYDGLERPEGERFALGHAELVAAALLSGARKRRHSRRGDARRRDPLEPFK